MQSPQLNPIVDETFLAFLLYDVLRVEELTQLDYFRSHDRETFDLYLKACRSFARDVLLPCYREMDEQPPRFNHHGDADEGDADEGDARVLCHPKMRSLYASCVELGLLTATRPESVGGQQLPTVIHAAASAYLSGANVAAATYAALSTSAAHMIESFGSTRVQDTYMGPLYSGRWCGTMALTEPQAGSGLMDIQTRATPMGGGTYLMRGAKVFISNGDNDFAENIVHLVLARIDGAPEGTRGLSLFVVPKLRIHRNKLVDNDVRVTGIAHKLGWRALPAATLAFGDKNACQGTLLGGAHMGLDQMFQMMNESRLGVGCAATATAMVAYHEALSYAQTRTQGRRIGKRSPAPVPIVDHADVRRMLLRQKTIAEGLLSLVLRCYQLSDLAQHGETAPERERATRLLDLLTPVAKSYSAEKGFESNALAVQVLGGYGYTTDYLPQAWLRDQKLNSIHEGTTCIQSLDLLGRKVLGTGGAILEPFFLELERANTLGARAGLPEGWLSSMRASVDLLVRTTTFLGAATMKDAETGLQDSVSYLDLFGTVALGWQWLCMATMATEALRTSCTERRKAMLEGELLAAQYWFEREMPRTRLLADVICSGDDSFMKISVGQL